MRLIRYALFGLGLGLLLLAGSALIFDLGALNWIFKAIKQLSFSRGPRR